MLYKNTAMIVSILSLVFAFGACSNQPETGKPTDSTKPTAVATENKPTEAPKNEKKISDKDYVFSTGSEKGTYYPVGNAIIEIVSKDGFTMSNFKSPGSTQNVEMIGKGEAQFALAQAPDMFDGYLGKGVFKDKTVKNLRSVVSIFPAVSHFVVDKNSGINSLADIKGKIFAPGPEKSSTERNSRDFFRAYGLDYTNNKDFTAKLVSFADATKLFDAKTIVGGNFSSGIPFSAVQELFTKYDVKMLDIDDTKADQIIKETPAYFKYTIKAKTYGEKQNADVNTLAANTAMVCSAELPEELVYNVIKTMFDKQPELLKAHASFSTLKLETALQGLPVPLHKGAEKYFTEKGVKIPDELKAK